MSGGEVPPFQDWSNFGAGDTWRPPPPGYPSGLWIDVTPPTASTPSPSLSTPPPTPGPQSSPPSAVGGSPPTSGSPPTPPPAPPPGEGPPAAYPQDRLPTPEHWGAPPQRVFRRWGKYQIGEPWGEIFERLEAERYKREGYDRYEFGEDFELPPGAVDEVWGGMGQPTRPAGVEIPLPGEAPPGQPPVANDDTERARRRQGARERDAIIRDAAERARRDSGVRRGRGVLDGVVVRSAKRVIPRIIGRVLGPIGSVIFPEKLGSGEVSEADRIAREVEQRIDELEQRAREIYDPYRGRQLGPEIAPLPSPAPPVISAPWPSNTPSPSPSLPQPSTPPQPRPVSTPRSMPAPSPGPAMPTSVPPWIGPAIATIGLGTLLGRGTPSAQRFVMPAPTATPSPTFTPPATAVDPLTPAFPTPGTDPLSPPRGNPLTRFDAGPLGSAPPTTRTRTRQRECECKPKKRKKPRECTTRGNLRWTSGPKKGQSAGSRCVTFKGKK